VAAGEVSRPLVAEIEALRAQLREGGIDRVVLCGMGGSSLAPEVITRSAGADLVVLDSTEPTVVRRALDCDLRRTVVVVSSKSGTTLETDSQRRAFVAAFAAAGIDAARRVVVVTDPGSQLHRLAEAEGHRVFLADPTVGGRYSALTAFGLVPSGLAGVDVAALLDDAESLRPLLAEDVDDNPALRLGRATAGREHWQARHRSAPRPGRGPGCAGLHGAGAGCRTRGARAAVVAGTRRITAHGGGCRAARSAVPAVGDRDRGGRPAPRHQPLRPA
jgi:glucose-6-phosphate isomerase